MEALVRLLKNTIYSMIAEIAKPFISLLLIAYISRKLGVNGVGQYGTVITFFFFFEILGALGLENLIVRDVAADQKQAGAYLTAAVVIGTCSTLVALCLMAVALELVQYSREVTIAVRIIGISMLFTILNYYLQAFFVAFQRMEFKSFAATVEALLRTGLGIMAVKSGYGLLGLIGAIVIAQIFVCFLCIYLIRLLGIKPARKIDPGLCKQMFRQTTTFLFITFVAAAYWRLDVLMLSKMKGMVDVGTYTAAYRLMEILKNLSVSYIAALFPLLSSSFFESQKSFEEQCIQSVRFLFILTFPISIGTTILADQIIALIYGSQFTDSVLCLKILIWTICLFPIALVFARALVASHNQKKDLAANIIGLVLNISLNIILIPRYGFLGASIATIISICLFFFIQYAFVSRSLFSVPFFSQLIKPFIAGCVMGLFTYLLRDLNLLFIIPSSACIYALVLFLLRTFSSEELGVMRNLWSNKIALIIDRA